MSLGSGHSSARCPRESFFKVYRLALSPPSAPEGNARWKWSWQLHLPPPYPGSSARQGPRTSPDAPGAPLPPLNFTARSPGGDRGLHPPPPLRAGRAQRPRWGLQGHFPHHFSPEAGTGAGPAAPKAMGGDGRHPHIPP